MLLIETCIPNPPVWEAPNPLKLLQGSDTHSGLSRLGKQRVHRHTHMQNTRTPKMRKKRYVCTKLYRFYFNKLGYKKKISLIKQPTSNLRNHNVESLLMVREFAHNQLVISCSPGGVPFTLHFVCLFETKLKPQCA